MVLRFKLHYMKTSYVFFDVRRYSITKKFLRISRETHIDTYSLQLVEYVYEDGALVYGKEK